MLGKLRIGPKLLLAPGVVLLLLIVLSAGAYYAMVRQNSSLEVIVQERAVHIKSAGALVIGAQRAHTEIYQLLAWIRASFSQQRLAAMVHSIERRHSAIDRHFAALLGRTKAGSAERRLALQAEAAHDTYALAVGEVIELAQVDQSISANAMQKAERAFDVMALRLAELSALEQELSERAARDAAADFDTISTLMPVVLAVSVVLSLLITMAVRRALLREVREIGAAARDLASGNLTVKDREYGKDEIAEASRALDASIRKLNATLRSIFESARSIDSASREMAEDNAGLSSRTEAQASSLERTASSMQELTVTVSLSATRARVANRLVASAASFAVKGGSVVERLVLTMASIKGSSRKVADIAGVIDHIACRSSTLAHNAALEAARAGDHGRGFAALVEEVRTLAQRSATAALDIKELIVQSEAEIEGGSASVAEAGERMADIVNSVQQVGEMMHRISQASAEQAAGMCEVNQAIVQLDQMTQQNLALVEEAAQAAAGLQMQALSLSRAVASFKLDEGVLPVRVVPVGLGRKNRSRPHLRLASKRG